MSDLLERPLGRTLTVTLSLGVEAMSNEPDAQAVCAAHGNDPAALLEILHDVQESAGYVPDAVVSGIAQALNLSRADVHGVVSFYHDFRSAPAGRAHVKICRAEACQSVGAVGLIDRLCGRHGLALGDTTPDGALTVEAVYCLGNCALGPAALVNGALHGRLNDAKLQQAIVESGA